MSRAWLERLSGALAVAALLAAWETACRLLSPPAYLLPTPSAVGAALIEAAPRLVPSAGQTFLQAMQALLLATAVGVSAAVAASTHATARGALRPLATLLQVTPVVAVAPLLILWVGLDRADLSVVLLAATIALFPLFSATLTGLTSADPDLERLFDLHRARPMDRLLRLRLPSSLPFMIEGLRIGAGQAIVGAVVAEFVAGTGATQGLAWRILEAGNRLRTAELLAGLAWLAAMGLALNIVLGALEGVVRKRFGLAR
ncbi:MAG TPA: ABC transporter permease subunit [Brevundimonas sp.]|jgi:NitT/TauT family transport system permease protein|uniref:ABC transporter permease n=1 Tax=Brevundimonas sp. TaxID=1871086 RepID=UPI002DED2234|nr:ABC transporter permease subunit [Brevundimonas sp.]